LTFRDRNVQVNDVLVSMNFVHYNLTTQINLFLEILQTLLLPIFVAFCLFSLLTSLFVLLSSEDIGIDSDSASAEIVDV